MINATCNRESACVINAVSVVHIDVAAVFLLACWNTKFRREPTMRCADTLPSWREFRIGVPDRIGEPTHPRAGTPTRQIYGVLEPVNAISDAGTPKHEIVRRLFVVSIAAQLPQQRNPCESRRYPITSARPTHYLDVIVRNFAITNNKITTISQ